MKKIISPSRIGSFAKKIQKEKRVSVLAGGCFDILHPGHIIFLTKAKNEGDNLLILLESDEKIKKLKGKDRPVNSQKERAKALSSLESVDWILMLPFFESDMEYEKLVSQIKPDVIVLTRGVDDSHHKRIAKLTGAKLKYVTKMIGDYSSSNILKKSS